MSLMASLRWLWMQCVPVILNLNRLWLRKKMWPLMQLTSLY